MAASLIACASCSKSYEDAKGELCRCAGCQEAYYCDATCQSKDWESHKRNCKRVKKAKADDKGIFVKTVRPGDEKAGKPKVGSEVLIRFKGWLASGAVFDEDDKGFNFVVGSGAVLPGWDVAIMRISKGEKAIVALTGDMAYGANPPPGKNIPPHASLIFEIELIDFRAADTIKTGTNFL